MARLTIGDLKRFIEEEKLTDDMPVFVSYDGGFFGDAREFDIYTMPEFGLVVRT